MRRMRSLLMAGLLSCVALVPGLAAQDHSSHGSPAHRHPPGVKIIMDGTLVEPVCAFAGRSAESARAAPPAAERDAGAARGELPPVLLGLDDNLYLLHPANPGSVEFGPLLNRPVVVRGTVYPAGSGYLIVVDSLRPDDARSSIDGARACPA